MQSDRDQSRGVSEAHTLGIGRGSASDPPDQGIIDHIEADEGRRSTTVGTWGSDLHLDDGPAAAVARLDPDDLLAEWKRRE